MTALLRASFFLSLAVYAQAASPFAFSNTLSDHAVLQNPIIIFGTGAAGSTVVTTVTSAPSVTLNATVGDDGIWRQQLPVMAEGTAAFNVTSRSRGTSIVLHDLLCGRTILCSGQSNIDTVTVSKALNATAELAACADWPYVRFMKTARVNAWDGPQTELPTPAISWSVPSATSCHDFSATCFFFGARAVPTTRWHHASRHRAKCCRRHSGTKLGSD